MKSKVDWLNSDKLQKIVSKNVNRRSVLLELGISDCSNNYERLNKYIKQYTIDISHFETRKEAWDRYRVLGRTWQRIPSEEMLIEHSTTRRGVVKARVIFEKLIPYQCRCGLTDIWQGEKLVLQLEHKNGVSDDHRIENLEFMCPNCHTQTKTFAGRNVKY